MVTVDINEYVPVLREVVEEGREVSMLISGNSMSPFLIHARDYICFKKPDRELRRGDMVFYQRKSGQFVMHRICKVTSEGYDIIGDNQTEIEHGIKREQIFGLITRVKRKGIWIGSGDFWWEFFAKIWVRIIPLRRMVMKLYGYLIHGGKHGTKHAE